ncbi:MAG: hypothetical protein JO217_05560 [Acidobacteriaceae bacterium]|nr:hypothetical protein [Acidobacteriaceae bacterium]MBV9442143.1 hypothetical protein [Acidobacteriaceae bacterium]
MAPDSHTHMRTEEEHERPEDMVEAPGEAEQSARSLEQEANSHNTLQGLFAMNDDRPPEDSQDRGSEDENREKGHPIP